MRHQTLDQLQTVAEIGSDPPRPAMTTKQRLVRWAELLEQRADRSLSALAGTEHQPPIVRDIMRKPGSALTVAADDPILRADGLKDDPMAKPNGSSRSATCSFTTSSATAMSEPSCQRPERLRWYGA